MTLNKIMQKIDYFLDFEKQAAEGWLSNQKALVTRKQLFKEMLTKTRMTSQRDLGLLTNYYSKHFPTKEALKHLETKLGYYTAVTPHSTKELMQAKELILNFRDANRAINLPAICLVIIPNYYPLHTQVISELNIISNSVIETIENLTKTEI